MTRKLYSSALCTALLPLALSTLLVSCQTTTQHQPTGGPDRQLETMLKKLYEAFSFDPLSEPDWSGQRSLCAEGAVFVAPLEQGEEARAVGIEEFIAEFRAAVLGPPLRTSGLHERITHLEVARFGTVAHAFVTFDAYVPGQSVSRRGIDSIQLVLSEGRWLLVSFTTQYEQVDLPIPSRFLNS